MSIISRSSIVKGDEKEDFLLSVDATIYNKRYYYDMVIGRFGGGVQGKG